MLCTRMKAWLELNPTVGGKDVWERDGVSRGIWMVAYVCVCVCGDALMAWNISIRKSVQSTPNSVSFQGTENEIFLKSQGCVVHKKVGGDLQTSVRPTHMHAHTTFAWLFYKDYTANYMGRFHWLFPHSRSLPLYFSFSFFLLFLSGFLLGLCLFLSKPLFLSIFIARWRNLSERRTWDCSSPILTFHSRF